MVWQKWRTGAFWALLKYNVWELVGYPMQALSVLIFFLTASVLFPFAMGVGENLKQAAIGAVWVVALMMINISSARVFFEDKKDGTIDLWMMSSVSIYKIVLTKIIALCLIYGVPLWIFAPVVGLALGMDSQNVLNLALSLIVTMPGLFCISVFSSSTTIGSKGGGLLSTIISLPLSIPFLIFGAAIATANGNSEIEGFLSVSVFSSLNIFVISCSLSVLAIVLFPFAISEVIKYVASND